MSVTTASATPPSRNRAINSPTLLAEPLFGANAMSTILLIAAFLHRSFPFEECRLIFVTGMIRYLAVRFGQAALFASSSLID